MFKAADLSDLLSVPSLQAEVRLSFARAHTDCHAVVSEHLARLDTDMPET